MVNFHGVGLVVVNCVSSSCYLTLFWNSTFEGVWSCFIFLKALNKWIHKWSQLEQIVAACLEEFQEEKMIMEEQFGEMWSGEWPAAAPSNPSKKADPLFPL